MNLEGEVSSFKIDWFIAIISLIFKRAWQDQFLCHALVHKTKNVYFFKMYKWYYYYILIFLMVSDLEKSLMTFLSRVQSSLVRLTSFERHREKFTLKISIFLFSLEMSWPHWEVTNTKKKLGHSLQLCLVLIKSGAKKTGHILRSVVHQISILELKLIKRGPNKMS